MADDGDDGSVGRRKKAAAVVIPLFVLGAGNVVLILQWGLNPVWGALLFPPVVFVSVLGWIAISGGLAGGGGAADGER